MQSFIPIALELAPLKRHELDKSLYQALLVVAQRVHVSTHSFGQVKKEEDGHRSRWIVPSMAFSAFRVEALCNIYGSQLFPHWDHFESTSFIGKIARISEFLKIEVDFSRQP